MSEKLSEVTIKHSNIQYLVPDFPREETKNRFDVSQIRSIAQKDPIVIHWCGNAKPISKNKHGHFTGPMTKFREIFFMENFGYSQQKARRTMWIEDNKWELKRQLNYYKSRIKNILKGSVQ